jgi:uncharacterized protein (AIM24 family)
MLEKDRVMFGGVKLRSKGGVTLEKGDVTLETGEVTLETGKVRVKSRLQQVKSRLKRVKSPLNRAKPCLNRVKSRSSHTLEFTPVRWLKVGTEVVLKTLPKSHA